MACTVYRLDEKRAPENSKQWLSENSLIVDISLSYSYIHGVRHGQKSGRANTEYIVYKNYNSL